MANFPKIAAASLLLASCGLSAAEWFDGSWSARVKRDDYELLYEVDIAVHHKRVIGRWFIDTFRPSSGCLIGAPRGKAVHFRSCTTDGSAGARDMDALCPDYHKDLNRFSSQGNKLAWEIWDARRSAWSRIVLLERARPKREVSWSDEECGNR